MAKPTYLNLEKDKQAGELWKQPVNYSDNCCLDAVQGAKQNP